MCLVCLALFLQALVWAFVRVWGCAILHCSGAEIGCPDIHRHWRASCARGLGLTALRPYGKIRILFCRFFHFLPSFEAQRSTP